MSDREATQDFAIKTILINHCGQELSSTVIGDITRELKEEMNNGPCSWAFKDTVDVRPLKTRLAEVEAIYKAMGNMLLGLSEVDTNAVAHWMDADDTMVNT